MRNTVMDVVKLLKILFSDETEDDFVGGYIAFNGTDICIDGHYNLEKMQEALDKFLSDKK